MKKLFNLKGGKLFGFLSCVILSCFAVASFASGFDSAGIVSTTECLSNDTVDGIVASIGSGASLAGAMALKISDEEEFEVKTVDEIDKLEDAAKDEYYNSLIEAQNKSIIYTQKLYNEAKEKESSNVDELQKQVNKLVESANEVLTDRLKELATRVEKQEKELNADSEERPLVKELKDNKEAFQGIKNGQSKEEIEIKALTLRANIVGNQQAVELPDIGQLATRRLSWYELFPRIPITTSNHNGTIRYYDWDQDTIVRAAAMVAEGAVFPESNAHWETNTIDLKKVGDTLPVTEEFFEDEEMFARELDMFLMTNVELEIDNQICNGDGTGQNLTGIFASVPEFIPANVAPVENATFYDLLAVMQEQITKTGGAKYMPDFVAMNITMINKMRLVKDANNNYIIPPFVSPDGTVVDGLRVVESNIVADDQLVLGDRRFGRIYEMAGMSITRGFVNTQFTEDEITLKIRKRLLFLIRAADATGFVKCSGIDAAIAAITAP